MFIIISDSNEKKCHLPDNKELIETVLFNQGALQEYIIICCQASDGGLIDKPGK